jgi:hypothetical protein
MISGVQISSMSFLASLESMGAIERGAPIARTLELMRQNPQELLTRMSRSGEPPLAALFRLHHQGFETDRRGVWWEYGSDTRNILKGIARNFGKLERPASDMIVAYYFSRVAMLVEKGGPVPLSKPSWYETYTDHRIAMARGLHDPCERALNFADIAVNLAFHGFLENSDEIFAVAAQHANQIQDDSKRTDCLDRLPALWAEAGSLDKALDYFKARISDVLDSSMTDENKGYEIVWIISYLMEARWLGHFAQTPRVVLDLSEKVDDLSARLRLKMSLLRTVGLEHHRADFDRTVEELRSLQDPTQLARFASDLETYVPSRLDNDLNRLRAELLNESFALAKKTEGPEARIESLVAIVPHFPSGKKRRAIFNEALKIARSVSSSAESNRLLKKIQKVTSDQR